MKSVAKQGFLRDSGDELYLEVDVLGALYEPSTDLCFIDSSNRNSGNCHYLVSDIIPGAEAFVAEVRG